MLDIENNQEVQYSTELEDFEHRIQHYNALLSECSVRTYHVLQSLQQSFVRGEDYLDYLCNITPEQVYKLRNAGRKTVNEIMDLVKALNLPYVEQVQEVVVEEPKHIPENIDTLWPIVRVHIDNLSARAKNAILLFMQARDGSLRWLYETIADPDFKAGRIKNIGKGTVPEVERFFSFVRDFVEGFADERAVEEAIEKYNRASLNDISIPDEKQDRITELEASLGYFPVFAVVQEYISGLDDTSKTIIENLVITHIGQSLSNRNDVSEVLKLSPERVRQKRNNLLRALVAYFKSLSTIGFAKENPYQYLMTRVNEEVNRKEGTDFSLDFVNWILGSTYDDVTFFGDAIKVLCGYYTTESFICLAPTKLCELFDFQSFIDDMNERMGEKRVDEVRVGLRSIIDKHLVAKYCEDELPEIETACRSILYLHYPVEVDYGQIIFKPNSRKNNTVIVEEIIRAAGHPLTLEEIYEEFIYQYPERYTEMNSFRGNIANSPNVVAIGRSSTYSLAEWQEGESRGGSIRQIAKDYLLSLTPTIAPISDLVQHILQYRPNTDEYNIMTNLGLEKTGIFSFYFRNGERYVGLSDNSYPMEYFRNNGNARGATMMSLYYPKLIDFIEQNGRFPFSSGASEEEILLRNFWGKQERNFRAGKLTESGLEYHTMITNKYGHLNVEKKDFEWRRHYELLMQSPTNTNYSEIPKETWDWFGRSIREYHRHKDKMSSWKVECIDNLLAKMTNKPEGKDNV